MTILYFTATGNSLYVAKRLGGKLISIPQMIKENKYEFSDERIGGTWNIETKMHGRKANNCR
ncbi:Uncharacterised protein (plasmid) [Enterococcus faecalis]|uniref:hypothetical protein n=1 Tax=Enterococcus faecalis TaxID=1351 RepID=UPI001BF0DE4D|nr:Uncharacterised protein [Enterococcus faecalis]